ncbi:MAG TPA: DinB family protein [Actinomycetota bacterium]|nr:DinB family protein [Actinomycetota bacterium]
MAYSNQPFYDGWEDHQRHLLDALRDLTPEQMGLRAAPDQWSVWQLAGHTAGARVYWFHDVLGEGDPAIRDMFRVTSTTVPGLPVEDAGWEDDENHPRTAAEIVEGLERSWTMIDECLRRWTPDDLAAETSRPGRSRTFTRQWVIWHLIEHDVHHGGAISLILGSNGLQGLDV